MNNRKNTDERQGDKLAIRRLLSNALYILRFAWEFDKRIMVVFFAAHIISAVSGAVYATYFLKYLIEILQNKTVELDSTVIYIVVGMLIVTAGNEIREFVNNWYGVRFVRLTGEVQRKFVKKAADIDLICYDNKEYFNDFVIAAAQSEEMIKEAIISTAEVLCQGLSIVILCGLLLSINPIIALFPVLGFVINIITRFKITEYEYNYEMEYKRIMRKADYSKRVFYQPEYAKEIKLSDIDVPLHRQFNEAVDETMGMAHKFGVKIAVLSLINWICTFTILSGFAIPVYLGHMALVQHSIALGDVAALNNGEAGIRNNLDGLNYAFVKIQKVGQFVERFRRFVDYQVQIEGREGQVEIPKGKHTLEIKDMSFRYDGADHDTLKHINMTIQPGEKVAFVGENGAGKTTFVKLLMRLYDVSEGSICFGGHDIREYSTKEYRDCVGAVFQDYQIYGATLGENVLMRQVKPEDEKQIIEALKLADFGEKLKHLPEGIQTNMTKEFVEDGTMLSGGEAQKVAIARMFAKSREMSVAILDEPSSALDPLAEYKLNTNMMESAKNATIIFISHRLSTTRDADHIYMFENGEIVEQGTHEELMAMNGKYAFMFEKQAHYYQDEIQEEAI